MNTGISSYAIDSAMLSHGLVAKAVQRILKQKSHHPAL